MCSPACMDRLFVNLKVLGQLQAGQKLYTTGDYLVLDDGFSYKQAITRWWMDETKDRSFNKIKEIVRGAIYCGNHAINSELITKTNDPDLKLSVKLWESSRDKHLQINNLRLLRNLCREMRSSIGGLKNLKETYRESTTLRVKMDNEIDLLERYIEEFDKFIKTNSEYQKKNK